MSPRVRDRYFDDESTDEQMSIILYLFTMYYYVGRHYTRYIEFKMFDYLIRYDRFLNFR